MEKKISVARVIEIVACAAIAILYLYTARFGQLPVYQQRGILLSFCYVLIFYKFPMFRIRGKRPIWTIPVDVVLSVVTILGVAKLIIIDLVTSPFGYSVVTTFDTILAAGLIVATLEATRRTIGWALTNLCVIFLIYAIWGDNLPGIFRHLDMNVPQIFDFVGFSVGGIWGVPLYVSSSLVILFLIFASLMSHFGLLEFLTDLSQGLVGRYRGGTGKVAVVSSSFMAMMSGSAVANVVATGSITIPLMIKNGYKPKFAGAIEACASTGGVITPPVMGAAAFIIAEYLGISYWAICIAAFIPAFLFFLSIFVNVDLMAKKSDLVGLSSDQLPKVSRLLLSRGYLLLPLYILIHFLGIVKSSPALAVFWSTVCLLAVALIRKDTRKKILGFDLLKGFADGVQNMLPVIPALASAGIIVGTLSITGLSVRLSSILVTLSGENVFFLLLFCAIAAIILGTGMTTTAVYIMLALVVAPALIRTGIPPLAAHLFIFFYGCLSHITPPVCLAVYMACSISGGKVWETAIEALKISVIIFMIPFLFVFNTNLIMQGNLYNILFSFTTAILGTIAISFSVQNESWIGKINNSNRILFGVGGLMMVYPNITFSLMGLALLIFTIAIGIVVDRKRYK